MVLTLDPTFVFFGTVVTSPKSPLVVSQHGIDMTVAHTNPDLFHYRQALPVHIDHADITRLESHFCDNLCIMYIAVNAYCSWKIRKALGLTADSCQTISENFDALSRNSCHTKIMVVLESTDMTQAKMFTTLMYNNMDSKNQYIFTELNHTSALSGYAVLKKVVNKDGLVPVLSDKCVVPYQAQGMENINIQSSLCQSTTVNFIDNPGTVWSKNSFPERPAPLPLSYKRRASSPLETTNEIKNYPPEINRTASPDILITNVSSPTESADCSTCTEYKGHEVENNIVISRQPPPLLPMDACICWSHQR